MTNTTLLFQSNAWILLQVSPTLIPGFGESFLGILVPLHSDYSLRIPPQLASETLLMACPSHLYSPAWPALNHSAHKGEDDRFDLMVILVARRPLPESPAQA